MNIDGAWKCYEDFTSRLSDLTRQLAFAGIAVAWIFKGQGKPSASGDAVPMLSQDLILALALFAICLLLDYSQYLFASIVWRLYARSREKEFDREGVPIDQDFSHPNWLTWLYTPFFWLKVAALGVGQAILIAYLMRQWLP